MKFCDVMTHVVPGSCTNIQLKLIMKKESQNFSPDTKYINASPQSYTNENYLSLSYGDMLMDNERNQAFQRAIESALEKYCNKDFVHVIDIGSGSGYLAMLAARASANRVTAVEQCSNLVECARKIVERNGFKDVITVIEASSTEINERNIGGRADIVVAEIFDTELIGEGAINIFRSACHDLLKSNAMVIPAVASVYVRAISSLFLRKCFEIEFCASNNMEKCNGLRSIMEIDFDSLPPDSFDFITSPVKMFKFDFADPSTLSVRDTVTRETFFTFNSRPSKSVDAILMWWELDFLGDGSIILSTEPSHSSGLCKKWRYHWKHGVYALPHSISIEKSELLLIYGCHDEFQFWFNADIKEKQQLEYRTMLPICTCDMHRLFSPNMLYKINDMLYFSMIFDSLKTDVNGKHWLCIGEVSVLPLWIAKARAKSVCCWAENERIANIMTRMFLVENRLYPQECLINVISNVDNTPKYLDCVVNSFCSSNFTWADLEFWYVVHDLQEKLGSHRQQLKVYPHTAVIWCTAVEFEHFWKIFSVPARVEGLDLLPYKNYITTIRQCMDHSIETYYLYEYNSLCCSSPVMMMELDMLTNPSLCTGNISAEQHLTLTGEHAPNALVFWVDWKYGSSDIVVSPLVEAPIIDEPLKWFFWSKAGIYYFGDSSNSITQTAKSIDVHLEYKIISKVNDNTEQPVYPESEM
ncbi:Protein arginine N-methyltransferase 7 [Trichinella britovi]|uniref:Protein arginine N-methyltransferase n=1 Tax=Trichinella britovi TaxID=45882 RepID=A0A0V1D7I3_TRIBR|nr:Protein arginine N-methyltransferase 7 [Trichinella britovi]